MFLSCYDARMKRRNRNEKSRENGASEDKDYVGARRVSSEALRGVSAIFFIAISLFLILARFGVGGGVGGTLYKYLSLFLGIGYLLQGQRTCLND